MARDNEAVSQRTQEAENGARSVSGTMPRLDAYPATESKIPIARSETIVEEPQRARAVLFDPLHAGCVLVRLDGEAAGRVTLLERSELIVGRTHSADVQIHDTSMSREHARIVCAAEGWSLQDLGSKNGTRVNGKLIESCALNTGDTIEFGRAARFRFTLVPKLRESESSSMFDSLTGVYSARYFDARLQAEVAFARRHRRDCSLILIEPDEFDVFYQQHGASVAESALQQLAATSVIALRVEDVFARQDRCRFALLMRDTSSEATLAVKERLLNRVRSIVVDVAGTKRSISVSAGHATLFECPWPLAAGLLVLSEQRLLEARSVR